VGGRSPHPAIALSGTRGRRLFYLVGASGAGKDSLLAAVRRDLPAAAPLAIAHRYITRPAAAGGENHVALSEAEFHRRLAHGCFAMHWHSHGLHYGIGREIDLWLAAGLDVMLNGSRSYLREAQDRYPELTPLHVQVSPQRLRERLLARGRESEAQIERRLEQAARLDRELAGQALRRIDNDGTLAEAAGQLQRILLGETP
jgi:ribose 1,5-bisphosphokinase